MATLTSNRLYDLIERLFPSRRSAGAALFARERWHYSVVRRLAEEPQAAAEKADDAWLRRIELRGSEAVINILQRGAFRDGQGGMHALFVDGRCGLISAQTIGNAGKLEPERAVADILARASNCHADGIILATNDRDGKLVNSFQWNRLVGDLYRKGEATEIFLLDHFVLTANGWKRIFSVNGKGLH